jgi:hypothetical protein
MDHRIMTTSFDEREEMKIIMISQTVITIRRI